MNPVAACAFGVLEAHPHPALRVQELLPPVAERVDRTLTATRLRQALAEHPECFRLLDPWQGPWRTAAFASRQPADMPLAGPHRAPTGAAETDPSTPGLAPTGQPDENVWVVLLTDRNDPGAARGRPDNTLRECVRWLARNVDPRSAAEVSRWHGLVLAERESRRAIFRRAA